MNGLLPRRLCILMTPPVQTHKVGIGKRDPIEVTLDIVHSRPPKLFLAAAAPVKIPKVKAC